MEKEELIGLFHIRSSQSSAAKWLTFWANLDVKAILERLGGRGFESTLVVK